MSKIKKELKTPLPKQLTPKELTPKRRTLRQRWNRFYWGPKVQRLRLFKSHLLYLPIDLRYRLGVVYRTTRYRISRARGFRLGHLFQYEPRPRITLRPFVPHLNVARLPSIALVTPSFEQAAYLENTLQSVITQNYPKLHYFVQDGNSQDGSLAILKKYQSDLLGYESSPDGGQSNAINLGFQKTPGEIMGWLNSDDVLMPGALHAVGHYFAKHPKVDVIYGNRLIINELGEQVGHWVLPAHEGGILSWVDFVPQETLFWRRSLWEKVGGGIDESFRFAMDWELILRFREAGAKFTHLPQFLACFRVHSQQKTSTMIAKQGRVEMDLLRQRHLGYVPSDEQIYENILPYLKRHRRAEIAWRLEELGLSRRTKADK